MNEPTRDAVDERIRELYLLRHTDREIAEALGLHRVTVTRRAPGARHHAQGPEAGRRMNAECALHGHDWHWRWPLRMWLCWRCGAMR